MAITIDWATFIISVPQADLIAVGGDVYELDADWFRLQLKSIEDSEEGIPFPDTHIHTTEVTLSDTTYSRFVQVIDPYSITFEDTGTPYVVSVTGGNTNILDVTNLNNVSVRTANSAGLVTVSGDGGGGPIDPATVNKLIAHIWAASGRSTA
jgi:hypothetical protein